jgi:hypothetical protein
MGVGSLVIKVLIQQLCMALDRREDLVKEDVA